MQSLCFFDWNAYTLLAMPRMLALRYLGLEFFLSVNNDWNANSRLIIIRMFPLL